MAGEKNTKKVQTVSAVPGSEVLPKLAGHNASGSNGVSNPAVNVSSYATYGLKDGIHQGLEGEQGANPPTSYYNYYYPGYNGSFAQPGENVYYSTDGSHTVSPQDMQSENGSLVYYMPGYSPYAGGTLSADGQNVGQQQYYSSGYFHPPVSYGLDTYSWNNTYTGDISNGNVGGYGSGKYSAGSTTYAKSNGYNSIKTNGNLSGQLSKPCHPQSNKPTSKVPYFVSNQAAAAGSFKGYQSVGRYSTFNNQKLGAYPQNGAMNYGLNRRQWNQNDRYKASNRNTDFENSAELTCGPRATKKNSPLDSPVKCEEPGLAVHKGQYNLPDFKTDYENAKFFVIKSYSEDDVQKCVKFDVWSSTPNGNKKLNAVYHDVEAKESENETKCPIFLFFSVNGSGQFVGLAEMVGQVDFNKDMDFWRLDKWNGFFPVKWHIVKDVPNNELRHILLENNDNRPVTFSRDTQEIGLKQGLEMLKIFKGYEAKTSLLDDFSFYEARQKSLNDKNNKPATLPVEVYQSDDIMKQAKAGGRIAETNSQETANAASIIDLTKKLSLNGGSCTPKENAVKNPTETSPLPSVAAP